MANKKRTQRLTKKELKKLSKMKRSTLLIIIILVAIFQGYNYFFEKNEKTDDTSIVTERTISESTVHSETETKTTTSSSSRAAKYDKATTANHLVEEEKTTFTAADLNTNQASYIKYGELDRLGRVTTANAVLTKEMYDTGTKAEYNIKPTGFISGNAPYNHSRGHLIGKQLGGSGTDRRNLMTIYQYPVNSPDMTNYENAIRRSLLAGDKVRYRVTPVFEGDDLMPAFVKMEGQSLTEAGDILFNVTIKNEK
ncbi:DNA/RNA non-specific endonuclease [Brochothrix campestris]|uniref:DNA/RNA non-specific endonuclease n=1 Tax=Brochothrix campestris TaxID=2757 RepID=UPI0038D05ABF